MRLVSVVVPDWEMATMRVSLMSSRSWKPDSSVAVIDPITRPEPPSVSARAVATAWPATAAVPWPITSMRRKLGIRARRAGVSVSAGRRTWRRPPSSTSRPRSVLRNEAGASEISFNRKWGASPRSMSRVVTAGTFHSSAPTGSGVPS